MTYRTSLLLTLILLLAASAQAATHRVPSEYGTIQAGVDACAVGDTVLVAPGTYTGEGNHSIDFHGVNLVLTSEAGPEKTIIDCEDMEVMGIDLQNNETAAAVICGVTVCRSARGGVHLSHSSPTITNVILRDNIVGGSGGGLDVSYASIVIRESVLKNNVAGGDGGGVKVYQSHVDIIDVDIVGNRGTWGGGINSNNSTVIMENCRLLDNWGIQNGGGFRQYPTGSFHIDNCEIRGNYTTVSSGGGMWIYGDGLCENTIISENRAEGQYAGGLYFEGVNTAPTFRNVVISRNAARSSGAGMVVLNRAHPLFENCTISENAILDLSFNDGSGVTFAALGAPVLTNCIVSGNTGSYGIFSGDHSTGIFSCNNVWGNVEGNYGGDMEDQTGLNGNISEDPQFCGIPDSGNYYLQSDSPCAPGNNDCGVLMGALSVGCGTTATEDTTISEIKSLYDE